MRVVVRFLSWFLLVPYFGVQLIQSRPLFFGDTQEVRDHLRGQFVVTVIVLLVSSPAWGLALIGHNRLYAYSLAAIISLFIWWVVGRLLSSVADDHCSAEFKLMPLWRRYAFGLSTLGLVLTAIALMPRDYHGVSPARTHPNCDDAASEMRADDCSTQ